MLPPGGQVIKEVTLDDLKGQTFDLTPHANLHRYRFIDAAGFADGSVLRVIEYAELPERFSAISYVWKGNPLLEGQEPPMGAFVVEGALGADPVSIDVIKSACCTALHYKRSLIWLDKVCIAQAIDEDKNWQIKIMGNLYKKADPCIIIPGGLSRLVPLEEPTSWIGRAWTLQEALLPQSTKVLFLWRHGDAGIQGVMFGHIREMEPGKTAVSDLVTLLDGTMRTGMEVVAAQTGDDQEYRPFSIPTFLFGNKTLGLGQCLSLRCAVGVYSDGDPQELKESAIWKSAIMRTSSRAVDMVFSIMALFGVQLDTAKFHRDDRRGATIALLQELMRSGRRASWIVISPRLKPDRVISTMPVMPKTRVGGVAEVEEDGKMAPVGTVVNEYWWLKDAPTGDVDELGYFNFTAPARMVRRISEPSGEPLWRNGSTGGSFFGYESDIRWELCEDTDAEGPDAVWAIQIGIEEYFRIPAFGLMHTGTPLVLMLVRKHGTNKYHRLQVAEVVDDFCKGWSSRGFNVGGPEDFRR